MKYNLITAKRIILVSLTLVVGYQWVLRQRPPATSWDQQVYIWQRV